MNKKHLIVYFIMVFILEMCAIFTLGNSEAKLTFCAVLVAIPIALLLLYFAYSSYENTLLFSYFIIPLLPLGGYILLRVGLLKYQWLYYFFMIVFITLLLFKNNVLQRVDFKKIQIKDKIFKIILLALLLISSAFAYNKKLSFSILIVSFIPLILLNMVLLGSDIDNREDFNKKILKSVFLGAILSAMPDFLYYIISLVSNNNSRLFGPLGSNALLAYTLIFFTIALSKWATEKKIFNEWTIFIIGFMLTIGIQQSRGALVAVIAIFILYILFDIRNIFKYLVLFFILGGLVFSNVSIRPDVVTDESIGELQEVIIEDIKPIEKEEGKIEEIILNVIDSQSKTRQIIWKTAISITEDYPGFGVGIGNYKYFFNEYSGTNKSYSDAHSILLNMCSEIGIPFMCIALIYIIYLGIVAVIKYFKEKDKDVKRKYVSIGISLVIFMLYGNLTGIAFQFVNEIFSFTSTFMILFFIMYRDEIEQF